MKTLFYMTAAFLVMGLAFWAYQQNYETQAALKESARLKRDIGVLRERLAVLDAEWAYLNRPDRLAELAEINFDQLGLLPLTPEQFDTVERVSFPPHPLFDALESIEVSGRLAADGQFP